MDLLLTFFYYLSLITCHLNRYGKKIVRKVVSIDFLFTKAKKRITDDIGS